MNESVRPSRQFITRGGIAIGIVAIILIVQTGWFRALFNKEPLPAVTQPQTIGEIIVKDSNKNGLPDWEEKLWGLDPTVLYTDGVPNKTIIEQKKVALGMTSEGDEPADETDALARELLTVSLALGQSGEVSNETLGEIAAKMARSIDLKAVNNFYSIAQLKTTQTTSASLTAYYEGAAKITEKYTTDTPEINIVIESLESGDMSRIPELSKTKTLYEAYAKQLSLLAVPIGVEHQHLEIINSIHGMATAFGYLTELADNSVNGLAGIALYKTNDARLTAAIERMRNFLTRYGILTE